MDEIEYEPELNNYVGNRTNKPQLSFLQRYKLKSMIKLQKKDLFKITKNEVIKANDKTKKRIIDTITSIQELLVIKDENGLEITEVKLKSYNIDELIEIWEMCIENLEGMI